MKITPPQVPVERASLFVSYIDNMTTYLKSIHPECSTKRINDFVRTITEEQCKLLYQRYKDAVSQGQNLDQYREGDQKLWPTLQVLHYSDQHDPKHRHLYGCQTFIDDMSALDIINHYRNKIITPFGSIYETVDKTSSFLKGMITQKKAARKKEKKLMLEAKKANDAVAEVFHNNNQATIKINLNSLIGGMGTAFCFLSSKANFNAVTSTSRFFVMNSYAHIERFLCGNFFFSDEEHLINHIVNCVIHGPDDKSTAEITERYGWKIPTSNEVYDFLVTCLHRNMLVTDHPRIRTLLNSLSNGQLCFLFYMSNLKNMVLTNEEFWRAWIYDFFSTEHVHFDSNIGADSVYKLDGDLAVVISTVFHSIIPTNDAGNTISIYDCVIQNPEVAQRLACIGWHMTKKLDEIMEIFELYTNHKIGIPKIAEHKYMFRDAVLLSDTDSSIFVTKDWAKWYTGSYKFTPDAFNINALVVFLLSKANASVLANLSIAFGAINDDIYGMNMKNEFMMPVLMLTSIKKCYVSLLKIQEGVFYSKQRLDIKGVALRGSNFGKLTLNYVQWFVRTLLDEIYTTGKIKIKKYLLAILKFERTIYDSLYEGETKFLTVEPIKNEEEYAESERSIYFNYLFWEAVFGDKYGNIAIPTKCYVLPLKGINNYNYQDYLDQHFPEVSGKFKKFLKDNPKPVTRIPINPLNNHIPEELRMVSNYRAVIYSNARPLYLILNSLGIVDGSQKKQTRLFSDIYGWINLDDTDRTTISQIIKEDELDE